MSEQNLNEQNVQPAAEDMDALRQVRFDKLTEMQENGNDPFVITKFDVTASTAECRSMYEAEEAKLPADLDDEAKKAAYDALNEKFTVTIAGRIMSWRKMGKANFLDLRDRSGRLQVYVRMNDIGEDAFTAFRKWDIGDIMGVTGTLFRTRTGELSVHATAVTLLSKSLNTRKRRSTRNRFFFRR